jgi:uncharacterized protein YndB with AHSA1/START domain
MTYAPGTMGAAVAARSRGSGSGMGRHSSANRADAQLVGCRWEICAIMAPDQGSRTVSVDVRTEATIRRPVREVAAYAGDPANAPEWYANIDAVEWKTAPPLALGSRVAFTARFLGRRLTYTYEIVELVPGERLVMRTAEGPFPMETTYTWSSTGDGATRMALRNRGEPAGFSRLVAPLIAPAMRRANAKDLARLANLLESPEPPRR